MIAWLHTSEMNYSIKIVTFNVKPEVGNGFESKIRLFKVGLVLGQNFKNIFYK